MITKVDRKSGYVVFKVVTSKGKLVCYRVLPEGVHDASKAKDFPTLTEARDYTQASTLMREVFAIKAA